MYAPFLARYLMLILKQGEVYFLDRDNSVFTTDKFTFPRRKNPDEHIFDTLIDGVSETLKFSLIYHYIIKLELNWSWLEKCF